MMKWVKDILKEPMIEQVVELEKDMIINELQEKLNSLF